MRKTYALFLVAAFLFTLCLPLGLQARDSRGQNGKSPVGDGSGNGDPARISIFVQVVIYDVSPASVKAFETELLATRDLALAESTLINERVLRNIDDLATQYATYSKFTNAAGAEQLFQQRLIRLQSFCTRQPEVHLAELTNAYFPEGSTDRPTGVELATDKVGQTAHLGLFIPYPRFRAQYEQTLHEVKLVLQGRKSSGYIGEETSIETELLSAKQQTPYSPQVFEASKMSINYGEYDTMENAENAYIVRHARPDPKLVHLERNFFSALQVPTRFYLFQVIGNYGRPDVAKRNRTQTLPKGGGR
jgi:hypothetical protein